MCYFEQRTARPLPSPAGWRRLQGTRRGPRVRGPPKGSGRGWAVGRGSGAGGSALTSPPSLATAPRSAGPRSSAPNPLLRGNACLSGYLVTTPLLHSNEDPGPQFASPPRDVGPLPSRALRASRHLPGAACSGCRLLVPRAAPEPRSRLALTWLWPLLLFTCDFAKTRHQTRASIPGCWFVVCARAKRDETGTCRPLSRPKPSAVGACALSSRLRFSRSIPIERKLRSEFRAGNGSLWQERGEK